MVQNETDSRAQTVENLIVSPNPSFNNTAWLSFEIFEDSDVIISISNFLGLNIAQKEMSLESGVHNFKLSDLFSLTTGSYILAIEGDNNRSSDIIIIR